MKRIPPVFVLLPIVVLQQLKTTNCKFRNFIFCISGVKLNSGHYLVDKIIPSANNRSSAKTIAPQKWWVLLLTNVGYFEVACAAMCACLPLSIKHKGSEGVKEWKRKKRKQERRTYYGWYSTSCNCLTTASQVASFPRRRIPFLILATAIASFSEKGRREWVDELGFPTTKLDLLLLFIIESKIIDQIIWWLWIEWIFLLTITFKNLKEGAIETISDRNQIIENRLNNRIKRQEKRWICLQRKAPGRKASEQQKQPYSILHEEWKWFGCSQCYSARPRWVKWAFWIA